ncbi:MAG: hypothetical protein JSR44_11145 [Spirochaetes bacterium]|nr:hypothetical protein [Spirochaetota bacterium]
MMVVSTSLRLVGIIFVLLLIPPNCSNIGLRDKLENPAGIPSPDSQSKPKRLYAFITSITSRGDMADFVAGGCSGTGISKADCVCNALGVANGLSGPFVAWLSTASADMTCRLFGQAGSACALSSTETWFNTQDQVIAMGTAGLFSGNLQNPLQNTESKNLAVGVTAIWSGTDGAGLAVMGGGATSTCNTWAANISQNGSGGSLGSLTPTWTKGPTPSCSASGNIYCFAIP